MRTKTRILSLLLALALCLTLLPTAALADSLTQTGSVTFDANGGHYDNGSTQEIVPLRDTSWLMYGEKTPVRDGYTFAGWTVGGQKIEDTKYHQYQDGDIITAQWEKAERAADTCQVVFVSEGMPDIVVNATDNGQGYYVVELPDQPKRPGYSFMGWTSRSDGTVEWDFKCHFARVTQNTTFKAVWEAMKTSLAITFDANGGKFTDGSTSKTYTVSLGSDGTYKLSQKPEEPTRDGYVFAGWKYERESADLANVLLIGNISGATPGRNQVGASEAKLEYESISDIMSFQFGAVVKVYADWKEASASAASIVFHANGGKFADGSDSKICQTKTNSDGTVTLTQRPEQPTREGYTFVGWTNSTLKSVIIITDTAGTSKGTQVGASGTTPQSTADIMSYNLKGITDLDAQWTENKGSGAGTSSTPAAKNPFADVASTSPFYNAILWAVKEGITNGTTLTTFAPGTTCTRGHILTFLWRSQGSPEPTIANPFKDEIPNAFRKAAIWAYEKGLISGTTFGASTPCTRAASVTYMWKLAGSPDAAAAPFSDVSSLDAPAVNWAVAQGVTNGTSAATFDPNATCTRGQIVTFLYRAYAGV